MEKINESNLGDYQRKKKTLTPPLAQLNTSHSSWMNDRLPEMLWAVLIRGTLEREVALEAFRHSLKFITGKKELHDITLSGIGNFSRADRIGFIHHILNFEGADLVSVLKPLLLFKSLPGFEEWALCITDPVEENQDWNKISEGLRMCLAHQSDEATDCRWVKVAANIIAGIMHCPEEMAKEILLYPNEGDQRKVRPTIRASEIVNPDSKPLSEWSVNFWRDAYQTTCFPEQVFIKTLKEKHENLQEELERDRKSYSEQTAKLRKDLITLFFDTSSTTAIDSKHEGVFGLALYGLGIFIENIFYRVSVSVNGRVMLRLLFETYATLAYLTKKQMDEPRVWDDYRSYGSGQANLVYRKFEEGNLSSSTVDKELMRQIANEDKWVEFMPINLGHWDSTNLSKMCEYIGEKELYDKYYSYTSAFVHANWAAVRETVFQNCYNPLHRLHRIPGYDLPLMSSVTGDMIELINKLLELVSVNYPPFEGRIISANVSEGPKDEL